MNPNQDLIDIINLNKLRDANDDCLLPESEKVATANAIEWKQRHLMNKIRLRLTSEQMQHVKEQEDELLKHCIDED